MTKVFGSSEWVLRLANLPWFLAGAAALVLSVGAEARRWWSAAFVTLACPFAWYYLDEARPYAMVLGASMVAVAALVRLNRGASSDEAGARAQVALFLLALVVLSGSSLLGMVWAGGALAALFVLLPRSGWLGW